MSLSLSEHHTKAIKVPALKAKSTLEPVRNTLSNERKAHLKTRYLKLKPILDAMPLD